MAEFKDELVITVFKQGKRKHMAEFWVFFQMCSMARGAAAGSVRGATTALQAAGSCVSVQVAACGSDSIHISVYLCLF